MRLMFWEVGNSGSDEVLVSFFVNFMVLLFVLICFCLFGGVGFEDRFLSLFYDLGHGFFFICMFFG